MKYLFYYVVMILAFIVILLIIINELVSSIVNYLSSIVLRLLISYKDKYLN